MFRILIFLKAFEQQMMSNCFIWTSPALIVQLLITFAESAGHFPILTPEQHTYNSNIGGLVTMKCTIDSSHHIVTNIMWTRVHTRIDPDSRHLIADNVINKLIGWTTLIIDNIQASDNTTYYCVAENQDGWGTSSVITLNVHALHLPIVSPAQASYAAIIGGSVKLICTITSSDHAITGVFWTKGSAFGSPTLSTGTKYVIANTGTTLQRFTSLIINSVMSTDEADYFCSAQNQDGTSISSITLHIPAQTTTEEETTTLQQTTAVSGFVAHVVWMLYYVSQCLKGGSCSCYSETVCTALKVFKWAYLKDSNLTFEEIKEEMKEYLDELKSNLTVDKKTTTAAIRRKISVRDFRTSAVSVGYTGMILLIIPAIFIFTLDFTRFIQYIQNRKRIQIQK